MNAKEFTQKFEQLMPVYQTLIEQEKQNAELKAKVAELEAKLSEGEDIPEVPFEKE